MADVGYFGKGAAVEQSGSLASVTVPWPAGVSDRQTAIMVVYCTDFTFNGGLPTIKAPDDWETLASRRFSVFGTVGVFSAPVKANPDPVTVRLSQGNGGRVDSAKAQIYVFDKVQRASLRGTGITIRPGNAGLWVTIGSFSGGNPPAIDTLGTVGVGYLQSPGGQYLSPNNGSSQQVGIELEVRPGPDVPQVISPAGQEVSNATPVAFRWVHIADGPQVAFQLRIRQAGFTTWSYVQPNGTISASETPITSGTPAIASPQSAFVLDASYEWGVRTSDGVEWSAYTPTRTFTVVAPPTVTVTGPGNLSNDLSPTVTWSPTFSGARVQTAFQVVIRSGGAKVYDSGVILGAAAREFTTTPLSNLTNGAPLEYAVTVTQTGGAEATGTKTATVSWTPPSDPTITATSSDGNTDGIQLFITADLDNLVDVQRTIGGSEWEDVALGLPVAVVPEVVLNDVLAPFGALARYRVRAANNLEGQQLTTGWVESDEVMSADREFYLVDSADPFNYVQVLLTEDSGLELVRAGTISYPIGGYATVDYGPVQGERGTIKVLAQTQDEDAAVRAIVTLNRAIWLRWPPDLDEHVPSTLVAIDPGPLPHERRYQINLPLRDWTLAWVEQK